MSSNSTGFGTSQKIDPPGPPGPPFAATSAAQGLMVDTVTGKIVLGDSDPSGAGAPLTADRYIKTNNNLVHLLNAAIDGELQLSEIGIDVAVPNGFGFDRSRVYGEEITQFNNTSNLTVAINAGNGGITISDGVDTVTIAFNGNGGLAITTQAGATFIVDNLGNSIQSVAAHYNFANLPNFANNAAALVGGLAIGDLYRTGGAVMIVI